MIVKPVLFAEYGITPERVIKLVRDIRSYITKTAGTNLSLQELSAELLKPTIKLFDELWAPTGFLKLFYNKTHTWRKIYASYSLTLFNNGGNINIWIMKVLGHTNIATSFAYANVSAIGNRHPQSKKCGT